MDNDGKGRVYIDPKVVQQDRELQSKNLVRTCEIKPAEGLPIRSANVSRYECNGDGINIHPGTYVKENTDVEGTPL